MAYCGVEDLLLNSVQLSTSLSRQRFVDDAADEIDSYLGWRYITPIDVLEGSAIPRPVRLTLKRVNAHLASGRLVLAAAMSSEDDDLHAYGRSLVNESLKTVREMAEGSEFLPGVPVEEGNDRKISGGPLLVTEDPVSLVDGFYDRFNPLLTALPGALPPSPAGQSPQTHSHDLSLYATSASVIAALASYLPRIERGASNGVASLASDGKVPLDELDLNPSGSLSVPVLVSDVWTVTVMSNWGLTAEGAAYYDAAGAIPSEAAIASFDAAGVLVLIRPGG